jgi:hypothetical protein
MSPQERRQLIEAIASLNGLQEGPREAFPDGTHYEYDHDLRRTMEVAPSGKRLPVALVAGKFRRDSQKVAAQKTAR